MKTNCCTTIPEINHVLIFSGNKCSTLLLVHSAVHRTYMCSRSTYYIVVPLNTHSILKYHYPLILYVTNIYAAASTLFCSIALLDAAGGWVTPRLCTEAYERHTEESL